MYKVVSILIEYDINLSYNFMEYITRMRVQSGNSIYTDTIREFRPMNKQLKDVKEPKIMLVFL